MYCAKKKMLTRTKASKQPIIQPITNAVVSADYRVSGKPRAVRRVGRDWQEAAEAAKKAPFPGRDATVGSEERVGERFRHARPAGSVQPPESGGGGGSLGGFKPGDAEEVARREYAGGRPHGACRPRRRRRWPCWVGSAGEAWRGGGGGLPVENKVFSSSFLAIFPSSNILPFLLVCPGV
jgi:hypothetical protein